MKIELPSAVTDKLRRALRRAGRNEIGGVLMGEQTDAGQFRIVDLSIDEQTGGQAHFVRSVEAHEEALDAFFARTGNNYERFNYLGEWHSHPSFSVTPSTTDRNSMWSLVHGERDIEFAVLLIVRLKWWWSLTYSCTLFRRGMSTMPVHVVETPLSGQPL